MVHLHMGSKVQSSSAQQQYGRQIVSRHQDLFSSCGYITFLYNYNKSTRSNYNLNRDEIKSFLNKIGRRKFLAPIYRALAETEENQLWAQEVYKDARKNYHSISIGTIDEILNFKK